MTFCHLPNGHYPPNYQLAIYFISADTADVITSLVHRQKGSARSNIIYFSFRHILAAEKVIFRAYNALYNYFYF